jgi:putative aldouronate transport system permease protein
MQRALRSGTRPHERNPAPAVRERKKPFRVFFREHWMLYLFLVPAAAALILFHYVPLWGIAIAFFKYKPAEGLAGSTFIGLRNFARFLGGPTGLQVVWNTIVIAVGKIIVGQAVAIAFALMLNEVRHLFFKRSVQTITTVPHFLSWVIVGGILLTFLSSKGPLNSSLDAIGLPTIRFLGKPNIFPWTLILSETWKEFGFGAIIYLAALTAINPELYEAAAVDGAGRSARMMNITIPGIAPTIVLMACLSIGGILNAGFDQVLILYNPMVYSTGDVISTYVYRVGLLGRDYGLGAAVGLFSSVIGFGLILLSYWLADRLANYRIF